MEGITEEIPDRPRESSGEEQYGAPGYVARKLKNVATQQRSQGFGLAPNKDRQRVITRPALMPKFPSKSRPMPRPPKLQLKHDGHTQLQPPNHPINVQQTMEPVPMYTATPFRNQRSRIAAMGPNPRTLQHKRPPPWKNPTREK